MKALVITLAIYVALCISVRLAHCEVFLASDFDANIMKFNDTWNHFFRKHFNCPDGAHQFSECTPDSNRTSYDGFPRVIHEFTHLFVEVPK